MAQQFRRSPGRVPDAPGIEYGHRNGRLPGAVPSATGGRCIDPVLADARNLFRMSGCKRSVSNTKVCGEIFAETPPHSCL